MTRYVHIAADGTITDTTGSLPLDTMQRLVGGYFDIIAAHGPTAPDGLHLAVNDDGLINGLPENRIASRLYYAPGYPAEQRYGIRGDVIVIRVDPAGETVSLTDSDVEQLLALRAGDGA